MRLASLVALLTLSGSAVVHGAQHPFTVRASIEMAHIVNFSEEGYRADAVSGTALISPDGEHALVEVRKGDIGKNRVLDRILLFRMKEVDQYLASESAGERPEPILLGEFPVRDDWGLIAHLQWLSDSEISFVAQRDEGPSQVYAINIGTRQIRQLTRSKTPVTGFAVSGDTVLYYAYIVDRQGDVVPVRNTQIAELLSADPLRSPLFTAYPKVGLYVASLRSGDIRRVDSPPVRLARRFHKIWISPKGRYAITLTPAAGAPPHWSDYRMPFHEFFGYTPDRYSDDPASLDLFIRVRYQLVDLVSGTARPLLDAPSGDIAAYYAPHKAFWSDDERSVIVTNTWLPLTGGLSPLERERRVTQPADAEIDLQSGNVTPIAMQPVLPPGGAPEAAKAADVAPVFAIDWDPARKRLIRVRRHKGRAFSEFFEKRKGRWTEVRATSTAASTVPTFRVHQTLNERPTVHVTGGRCRCTKELFDPNPEANQFLFGRVEAIKWTDANGMEWRGGLVYPVGYVEGHKYPLIVQTHGFQDAEFLINGPYGTTTAYAAQPLANSGFVVLQIADNRAAETMDERMDALYAEGFRAGIQAAVERGVADPDRVGIIGWSRSGLSVLHLIAAHPKLIRAATISDAALPGYMARMLNVNISRDAAIQQDWMNGAPLTPENAAEWRERQPMYRLRNTNTPVRMEAIGADSLLHMWELYALLKHANGPVDYVYYPHGSHSLLKPSERMESQGGNVDWFRFWLLGEEDPSGAKAEQYARWSRLRRAAQ